MKQQDFKTFCSNTKNTFFPKNIFCLLNVWHNTLHLQFETSFKDIPFTHQTIREMK